MIIIITHFSFFFSDRPLGGTIIPRVFPFRKRQNEIDCEAITSSPPHKQAANDPDITPEDIESKAERLQEEFEDLLAKVALSLNDRGVDVVNLRVRLNWFVNLRDKNPVIIDDHLQKLESITTPEGILNYLIRHDFIGYLNYELLKVFQKVIGSQSLDDEMEKYEALYIRFLETNFTDLMEYFKNSPPKYPLGLPKLKVHLGSEWNGRSMYNLREAFDERVNWASNLVIVKITRKCILLTFTVLPVFLEAVERDLRNLQLTGVCVEMQANHCVIDKKEKSRNSYYMKGLLYFLILASVLIGGSLLLTYCLIHDDLAARSIKEQRDMLWNENKDLERLLFLKYGHYYSPHWSLSVDEEGNWCKKDSVQLHRDLVKCQENIHSLEMYVKVLQNDLEDKEEKAQLLEKILIQLINEKSSSTVFDWAKAFLLAKNEQDKEETPKTYFA